MTSYPVPVLSKRLEAAAALVCDGIGSLSGKTDRICLADIGCDHALLPVALLQRNVLPFAIASDIRPGPLQSAKENAERYGVADRIRFVLSDGLKGLQRDEARMISVCGMGGELIARILSKGDVRGLGILRMVLMPHTKPEAVRAFLFEEGFFITDETVIEEDGKFYPLIAASLEDPGEAEAVRERALLLLRGQGGLSEEEAADAVLSFGAHGIVKGDPVWQRFLSHKERVVETALKEVTASADGAAAERLMRERKLISVSRGCASLKNGL